jgi:hypothetical protein
VANATATGESPLDMAVATGPQQGEMAVAAAAEKATAVASASLALAPTTGDQVVVDVADDDAPPHGWGLSYGPPWAHYLGGYQDRLLGGPLGLPGLRYTAPEGVEHKDCTGVVLG